MIRAGPRGALPGVSTRTPAQHTLVSGRSDVAVHGVGTWSRRLRGPRGLETGPHALVEGGGAALRVPLYWDGDDTWCLRFSPSAPGEHVIRFEDGAEARFRARPQRRPTNALRRHGAVRVTAGGGHFEHADGTPFLWLADSWWYGMCGRITDAEFARLARHRARLGYSVLQFAVGFACDAPAFDPRDANAAGHAWTRDLAHVNPAYFRIVDRRLECLVALGIVPALTAAWGYMIRELGPARMRRHWRYLAARYGAFPVVWNLCGESRLLWYHTPARQRPARLRAQLAGWTAIARDLKEHDPWKRPLSVHPGPKPGGEDVPALDDPALLDFRLLQPGHSDADALENLLRDIAAARATPGPPLVLVGECAWEGMHGGAGPKVQRHLFWAAVLSGLPGHAYGCDALWQMNARGAPFGPSPHGHVWGEAPWQEAFRWEGAVHVAAGARILRRFAWWGLRPCPEGVNRPFRPGSRSGAFCAASPDGLRLLYFPQHVPPWGQPYRVLGLGPGTRWRAQWHNVLDGTPRPVGDVRADRDGGWDVPPAPVLRDWALSLEPIP